MTSKFIAVSILVLSCFTVTADVVQPGHIHKQFMFTNLDKFPGYTFYYVHHGHHYDRGWQPNAPDTLPVENNMRYFVSNKGSDKEPLMIKDANGKYFATNTKFGGEATVSPSIDGTVEVFTIVKIKNGVVKVKKIKDILIYPDGKEKVKKGSIFGTWIGSDGFASGLAIVSTGALLGLVVLFLMRRRRPRYIQLTA